LSSLGDFLGGQYGWLAIFGLIVAFTLLTILYYTKKDKYDPEPPGRLILAFVLGVVSVIPALLLSILGAIIVSFNGLLMTILVAPIMEETAKLWFVIYLSKSDAFDGPLDGLIYGAMVGAGFAAAENLLYATTAAVGQGITAGLTLTAIRSVTQVVGHPLYTGLAGIGVGEWKVGLESNKYNKIWRSMLFHGLWNLSANLATTVMVLVGLGTVIVVNVLFLRRELNRALKLDKEAYDRGYYTDKEERLRNKEAMMSEQVQQWRAAPPQPFQPSVVAQQPVPESATVPVSPPNFCKQCGTKRREGDLFCRNCGFKLL